jgi:ADP-ribose pyrophosphatase
MKKRDLTEKRIASKGVFRGRLLDVREDRVTLPNGKNSTREYVVHPGAVVIMPLLENGDILLERQYRYPLEREFIEFPAGKIDPGEEPLACARRELLEETGYEAGAWRYVTTIYPCIGYSNERLLYYLATDLVHRGQRLDDDEFIELFRLPLEAALHQVHGCGICEAKTVAGLFWLEKLLRDGW